MFNFLKKKTGGETVILKLSGLHCVACSLTIDDELESIAGVFSATTSYAKQESIINYNPAEVEISALRIAIEKLGYKVVK